MKVLVTGATGFLGREVVPALAAQHEVFPVGGRHQPPGGCTADLTQPNAWHQLLDQYLPDVVLHMAAYRDPDFCETHPEAARRLNTESVARLVEAIPTATYLIFISTDYVFDGEHPPYYEHSPRRPLNVYGQTKAEAEDIVRSRPNSLVLRIPLLVGVGPDLERSEFFTQVWRDLRQRTPVQLDHVLRRFPTWTRDVAECIGFLLQHHITGTIHFSGQEGMTRYQMVVAAAEEWGLSYDHVRPSPTVQPRPAQRPRDSQLATDQIRALGFQRCTPYRQVARQFAAHFHLACHRLA